MLFFIQIILEKLWSVLVEQNKNHKIWPLIDLIHQIPFKKIENVKRSFEKLKALPFWQKFEIVIFTIKLTMHKERAANAILTGVFILNCFFSFFQLLYVSLNAH